MLLNVTYTKEGAVLRSFLTRRKSASGGVPNNPHFIVIALLLGVLTLCSFASHGMASGTSPLTFVTGPIAIDDDFAGVEDTPMTLVGITANDIDDDGVIDITTIDLDPVTNGQQTTLSNVHGTYSLTVGTGEITYIPTNDWNGTTSLAYTVQDDEGNTSNIAYLYITISSVVDAPMAVDDFASGFEDDPYINISMVQNNDFDPEGQGFMVGSIDINPLTLDQDTYYEDANGAWMVDLGYGTISFFPNPDFHGTAMIGYTIVGFTNMLSNVAMVYVDVFPTNDAPMATANSIVVNTGLVGVLPNVVGDDTDLENNIQVNTIDLEPLTAGLQLSTTTATGTWVAASNTSDVTFTANVGYSGTTSIMYVVSDSLGLISNQAALTAHIISSNNAPVAFADNVSGLEDSPFINVPSIADNDTDPNGDEQLVLATIDIDMNTGGEQDNFTNASGDWTVDLGTGTVTYIPTANFTGTADIWYTIKDIGGLESAPAHITITVMGDDDNPIAGADSAITNMDIVCFIEDILDNDFDLETTIDSSTVDLDLESPGVQDNFINTYGSWLYIIADEKIQYTPTTGFVGMATHEYSVQDGDGTRSLPAPLYVDVQAAIPPNASPMPNQAQFAVISSADNTHVPADSWSSTWVDINNDGWDDLFVSDKSTAGTNYVFQNLMGAGFEQLDASTFAAATTSVGSIWGDYDNDGDNDVVVINDGLVASQLYKNNGNGSFTVQSNIGINNAPQYIHGASWVDYDNDGHLDLMFSNYHQNRNHEIYHNNGDGSFTKITDSVISVGTHRSLGPVWCDYDNDGFQDLFVPNGDNQNNSLFHNNGDGTFETITTGAIVSDGGQSVGACWGDYDRDGDMDLFVANASNQNNFLYSNNNDGTFTKITNSLVVSEGGHSHGCSWMDIDNDADLDLYVTNDQGYKFLYINDGAGNFYRKNNEPIVRSFGNAFGQSWSDFDHDGDLDLYVSTHGEEPNQMFVNSGSIYNWIAIQLQGTTSNRNAIGSHIRVQTDGIWQTTQLSSQCGFNGQHSNTLHFGLGSATTIDSIEVKWPSGLVQHLTAQDVNQYLTIVETNIATLGGIAYYDANYNCHRDEDEQSIAHMTIQINETEHTIQTDAQGVYALPLEAGVYQIDGTNNTYWQNECNAIEQAISDNGNQYPVDVPFTPLVIGYDLATQIAGLTWERNSTQQTTITYENLGTVDAENTVMTVIYPDGVSIIDASIPWSYVNGNTYVWELGVMPLGSSFTMTLIDGVSGETQVGDVLRVTAAIHADGTDLSGHNNFAYLDREIVEDSGSNIIHVSPKGDGQLGYIERDQDLVYTIQFQNNGIHTANRLRIENTLPTNLDVNTFEIIAASNNYSYVITDDRHITIYFEDIDLPSSAISNLESQGVIMYRIRPLVNAPAGETIENKATMYFEYAEPVNTNDVHNTLRAVSDGIEPAVMLWPNPTNDILHISLQQSQIQFGDRPTLELVEIADSKGQIVSSWHNTGLYQLDFNTIELRAGAYQIRVIDQSGQATSGRFIVTKDDR
jgi:uncharacterized repeat protein (TIGR01451 family)